MTRSSLRLALSLGLVAVFSMGQQDCQPPDEPELCPYTPGTLPVGSTWTVNVDAHTGDEATTEPKTDAHSGQSGDNHEFRRYNVARAHNDYWYTSSHQEAGEPNPNGDQWVDFAPDFATMGVGKYRITTQYRATENRATYAAFYWVLDHADDDVLYQVVQERGEGEYVEVDLGEHHMCPGSFVRVQDPGSASISFHRTKFTFVGE